MAGSVDGAQQVGSSLKKYADWLMAFGVVGLMVTLITPMPPWILDLLLALNLTSAVLLLMLTMSVKSSIELSTFPTILLFTTLFRLGLNVASTRLILEGGDAGSIINAFGSYVVGENLAVGMVVFLILIVIQFVVITKGSGRVSEVAARFVLDAMPGKQMAIDADLNGGLIDADEAKQRRAEIATEAEFYGAMDGASKFVRGDAIAGLIITGLNLLGGITIGSMAGQTMSQAMDHYSKLTIGDGLVSQIPALFISTAAGVLVTKSNKGESLGPTLFGQMIGRPKATLTAAGVIFALGMLPAMPKLPFFVLATVLVVIANGTKKSQLEQSKQQEAELEQQAELERLQSDSSGEKVEELLQVDRVCLEIGYRLIPLVQDKSGGGILDHVAQLRRRFALKEGVLVPPVRVIDNIKLPPNGYRVMIGGQEVASGSLEPNQCLAMDSGTGSGTLTGVETVDPAFGLPAWWIPASERDEAEIMGYTVIDPTSVLVTHLSETLRNTMDELLSRDDVKELVEKLREVCPAVIEELVPDKMGYGDIQRVLRNLVRENVSVRNMAGILEALADGVTQTKDSEMLTELVRQRLGRGICERHADKEGTLYAVTLDPSVEVDLASAVGMNQNSDGSRVNPAYLQRLMERIAQNVSDCSRGGRDVVLLVRSNVRRFLSELARASLPKVAVLSYNEVIPAKAVETLAVVKMEEADAGLRIQG